MDPVGVIVSEATQSPLGSCLDCCESSITRKLPGGQQVVTGVLEEEVVLERRKLKKRKKAQLSLLISET